MEDELGDVLEKAMRHAGLNEETLAARTGVAANRIFDAIDYRPDLTATELRALAAALDLNEIGLCAIGCGQYPLPKPPALPFCVYPLRMAHGIGVANAYLVADCGSSHGVLFDTGPGIDALQAVWPKSIKHVDAVFVTHIEGEHAGGLCAVVERFGVEAAFCPFGVKPPCGRPIGEGQRLQFPAFEVTAFSTPGHSPAHNCYLVSGPAGVRGAPLLVSGDLFFAGSIGCAHFSGQQLLSQLRRMLKAVPPETVIAPGHGPMTTVQNELHYNPFVL